MRLSLAACAACAAALLPSLFAASIQPRTTGPVSWDKPTALPLDWHILSQAAGLSRQAYCWEQDAGIQVGDAVVLWSNWFGIVNQRVTVFHSQRLGVSVAFEGTTESVLSILHDVNFPLVDPAERLAPVFSDGVKLFNGFQDAYLAVADETYQHVLAALAKYNETRVTATGHSLGAAMAAIAGADYNHYLKNATVNVYAFGFPRTGNVPWADYIDQHLPGRFYYIVNGRDWVPQMPPQDWGFQHPSGQIWIKNASTTDWAYYPGQENHYGANSVDPKWNFDDHHGTYFHTLLGSTVGTCPAQVNTA
ncbi:hypothetical protein MCUN1_003791 [Malassezia cuniculi]|uniref:Fungal lipase-type domain-containing protein n=1 Tax=Malassezia cuniculi TaxID=948313 RepID=A0AAF0J8A0_9BASI|nr:hypothetical protein MCUN1_003791 [Malassezia cuniculi]